jgi:hypothetical protein
LHAKGCPGSVEGLNWGLGQKLACVLRESFQFDRSAGCVLGGESAHVQMLQSSVLVGEVVANFPQKGLVLSFLETMPALGVIVMML